MNLKSDNFALIYALTKHPRLGHLVEPYAVELNHKGQPTLSHKRLYKHTLESYFPNAEEKDKNIVALTTEYSAEQLGKRFNKNSKLRPVEFLLNVDDKIMNAYILPLIQRKTDEILSLLTGSRELFLKGTNDNPTQQKINIVKEPATILFHFRKEENETRYYPTIKNNGERIKFLRENCLIVCNEPCWFLVNDKLYHFDQNVEGKKLMPFLEKDYISVSKKNEPVYFKKFIIPLIERYPVKTHGFPVNEKKGNPVPVLSLERSLEGPWTFYIQYEYKDRRFYLDSAQDSFSTLSENSKPDQGYFEIDKIHRNYNKEEQYYNKIEKIGLVMGHGSQLRLDNIRSEHGSPEELEEYLGWLNNFYTEIENIGFKIETGDSQSEYYIGQAKIQYKVTNTSNDWFDIHAEVVFGEFSIPFVKLKNYILNNIREFKLPNGKIAILPNEWFGNFRELFLFGETKNGTKIRIKRHHYRLLGRLSKETESRSNVYLKKIQQLENAFSLNGFNIPSTVNATLRSYQKQGVNWLLCLRDTELGGCLADDMGLGKTLQTLTLLSKIKESSIEENKTIPPSIIIMPASLIHNWANEILKFTPNLNYLRYIGPDRRSNLNMIPSVDIILTTYGTIRNDIEDLKEHYFNYVILDESQNIKNPGSKIAKTVRKIQSDHKLVLTGTPIENSLTDLWSQMHFINPGLLGGYKFFKQNFSVPIEKKQDEEVRQNLKQLISPFILRRTKSQVAKELPSLTQKTHFCEMTPDQSKAYEKIKSSYRNEILRNIEEHGLAKSQIVILRGLTQLRLMANHPEMLKPGEGITSGKFDEVIWMLENVLEEGHKVLVYSQFVKHLKIFSQHFDSTAVSYTMLTGQTRNREKVIDNFVTDPSKNVFLISLKAGGAGLNLMAADYVFLLDPWWNPAVEQQAINRAHRIGQEKKVFSYRFITKNTIEEKILNLQERKTELSESLIQPTKAMGKILNEKEIRKLLD